MKFRCSFQHYSRRVCSRLLLAALCGLCHLNAQEIYIRANQIGYEPNATKIALAFCLGPLGNTFEILDAKTGKPLFHAQTQSVTGVRWGKFDQHVELDFSGFKQPGRYVVQLGTGRSLPFVIGPDIYAALPDQLLEFMRQQRCGYNPWLDAVCHPYDGRSAYGPLTNGTYVDARGGWHDAADLLKYHLTSGNATAQMLLAYQLRLRIFEERLGSQGNKIFCRQIQRARTTVLKWNT